MAWGNSLVIPSTYGYQYPPMAVQGPSDPADAPFVGGATRNHVAYNDYKVDNSGRSAIEWLAEWITLKVQRVQA